MSCLFLGSTRARGFAITSVLSSIAFASTTLGQGGDNAGTAVPLALNVTTVGTTVGYYDDSDEVCPWPSWSAPDVYYTYTPTISHHLTVDLCNSDYDTKTYVYDSVLQVVSDASGNPACNDDACSDAGGNEFRSQLHCIPVTAGLQYYIVVDGYEHEAGNYTITTSVSEGTLGDPDACAVGACCFDDGSCQDLAVWACSSAGGEHRGDGTSCAAGDCDRGACCFDDGSCGDSLYEAQCLEMGGAYQGDGIQCSEVDCDGACCFEELPCVIVSEVACTTLGGTFQGHGSSCATGCPVLGACCFDDGACTFDLEFDCATVGGIYQGDNIGCATASCPQPGACCRDDGSCTIDMAGFCAYVGGWFAGEGTDCATAACDQPGACCHWGDACYEWTPGACTASGGTFQGHDVACPTASCPYLGFLPVRDTTIYQYLPDVSNGSGWAIPVGGQGGAPGKRRRGLIAFDLAAIPAGAMIIVVALDMYHDQIANAYPYDVALHRMLADWGEGASNAPGDETDGAAAEDGDATWPYRFYVEQDPPSSPAWNTPGGDAVPTPSATTSVGGEGWYQWTSAGMIADVQAWVDEPSDNFGWGIIIHENWSYVKRFRSRQANSNHPKLRVLYTIPCPADFDGSGDVGFQDLLALLASWGPCAPCQQDLNGDGEVGFQDLLILLAAWGPC